MKHVLGAIVLAILLPQVMAAQTEATKKDSPFTFGASYVGDVVGNFSGGIKTGTTYLGMANITANLDTEKAGLWKGGEFAVNGSNTHGGEPSTTMIGDFQTVSNIEAGNHTYLYELWYKQNFGKMQITVGLQDLNADYANSEGGSLFNNSYFGIHSVCSDNVPAPIFPMTGLAVNFGWDIAEGYRWQIAVWDGYSYDWDVNPYNVKWNLSAKDGLLAVMEFQLGKSAIKNLKGSYKIGGYYYHSTMDSEESKNNYGIYFIGDQEISNHFTLFAQLGFSPKKYNDHSQCYGLGVNYKNFSKKRPDDVLGFALNHATFSDNHTGNETVFELIYHLQVNDNIYLKPDIQYIINPAGTGEKLNNALVGMFRFGIEF
ncbi:MAG: carbohydrate porin [Culturomica sp.]|jgi:porin|nr:carbohydrate porin [Culturomica sp.]